MAIPTNGAATDDTQIQIDWTALSGPTDNGGSTVLTYNLQWDQGTNGVTWYNLIGSSSDSLATTYTKTSAVSSGTSYQFRVRARNIWGYGNFSPVLTVLAADIPDTVATATTSYDSTTGDVIISWVAPNNKGSSITSYLIEIQDKAATSWTPDTTYCDGS